MFALPKVIREFSVSFGLLNLDQVSYDAIRAEDFEVKVGRQVIYRFRLAVVVATSNVSWVTALAPRLPLMWPVGLFDSVLNAMGGVCWSSTLLRDVFLGYFDSPPPPLQERNNI